MKPELTFDCEYCFSRETHCPSYIDSMANGGLKLGQVCPFYDLWTSLYLAKEIKRLHLVDTPLNGGLHRDITLRNLMNSCIELDVSPDERFYRDCFPSSLDIFIENNGDDGGY